MNVRCESCETLYRVDPAKVPANGVRARCTVCAVVIEVPAPGAAVAPEAPVPVTPPTDTAAAPPPVPAGPEAPPAPAADMPHAPHTVDRVANSLGDAFIAPPDGEAVPEEQTQEPTRRLSEPVMWDPGAPTPQPAAEEPAPTLAPEPTVETVPTPPPADVAPSPPSAPPVEAAPTPPLSDVVPPPASAPPVEPVPMPPPAAAAPPSPSAEDVVPTSPVSPPPPPPADVMPPAATPPPAPAAPPGEPSPAELVAEIPSPAVAPAEPASPAAPPPAPAPPAEERAVEAPAAGAGAGTGGPAHGLSVVQGGASEASAPTEERPKLRMSRPFLAGAAPAPPAAEPPARPSAPVFRPTPGQPATPAPAPPEPKRPVNPFLSRDPNQKARRLARALISDMIVYQPDKRQRALAEGNLKEAFDDEIKKSWEEYVEQVGEELASSTNHFNDALNDILADGRSVF